MVVLSIPTKCQQNRNMFFVFLPISKYGELESEDEVSIAHIKDGGLTDTRYIDLEIAAG